MGNIIKLIFKDLKIFITQKTTVFVVLIISLISASYAFCFFVANNMHMTKIINDIRNPSTKYTIGSYRKIDKEKIGQLEKWLKEKGFNETIINLYSDISNLNKSKIIHEQEVEKELPVENNTNSGNLEFEKEEHDKYEIIIGSNNNKSNRVSFVGNTITEVDIKNKSNYVMIEYLNKITHDNPFIINETIEVRESKYIVKAIDRIDVPINIIKFCTRDKNINNITSYVIPISTFLEKYNVYAFDIKVPQTANTNDKSEINEYLKKNFADCEIYSPIRIDDVKIEDVKENIVMFTILIILALINIVALFTYWINKNWRNFMIYRICGASKLRIYIIIVLEALLLCLMATLIGSSIYYLTTPLLKKIYISYVLTFKDILIIQTIILLVVFFNISLKAIEISKVNPRYMERGE